MEPVTAVSDRPIFRNQGTTYSGAFRQKPTEA